MTQTLALAFAKFSELPEAAQEQIGRELLDYAEDLAALRAEIQVGIDQADAGLVRELDFEALLRSLHEEHARG